MPVHAFIDESKANGYVVAAAFVQPHRLAAARRLMRSLCLPGQQRIHLTKEQAARRRTILAAVCRLDVEVRIYDASGTREPPVRPVSCRSWPTWPRCRGNGWSSSRTTRS